MHKSAYCRLVVKLLEIIQLYNNPSLFAHNRCNLYKGIPLYHISICITESPFTIIAIKAINKCKTLHNNYHEKKQATLSALTWIRFIVFIGCTVKS